MEFDESTATAILSCRWHLRYHSLIQVIAGYTIGFIAGGVYYTLTEYIPLAYPQSVLGRMRKGVEWLWTGVGGVGGHGLGDAPGGWGEGHFFGSVPQDRKAR